MSLWESLEINKAVLAEKYVPKRIAVNGNLTKMVFKVVAELFKTCTE